MLMECVEDRIGGRAFTQDKNIDYWWKVLNTVGSLPFHSLFKDDDRYHMAIYAAEFVRQYKDPEAETRNLDTRPISNPEYDPYIENVAQDGRHWGIRLEKAELPKTHIAPEERQAKQEEPAKPQSEDPFGPNYVDLGPRDDETTKTFMEAQERKKLLEDTKLSNIPKSIREQVEEKDKDALEQFVGSQVSVADLQGIKEAAPDTYLTKWKEAERMARLPKEAWQNAPYELVQMIKYCYGHLSDSGSVPYYPADLIEIWWKRPTWATTNMTAEAITRRDSIVEKIRGFWVKSVEANKDKMNLESYSYRVTLAAMKLESLIEEFANGTENETDIRQTAMAYFHAHFPVEQLGAKPGPESTLDPDYITYLKLCKKYNLAPGTLLHEAEL